MATMLGTSCCCEEVGELQVGPSQNPPPRPSPADEPEPTAETSSRRRWHQACPSGGREQISLKIRRRQSSGPGHVEMPAKRGPPTDLPEELVDAVAGYAQLKQVAGEEQKPRQLLDGTSQPF